MTFLACRNIFYGSDFSCESLCTQLEILSTNYDGEGQANIHQVFKYCRNLTPGKRALMGEVIKLVIENYYRTTMFQKLLNNLMVTYVYKDRVDLPDLTSNAQDFVVWFF